MKPKKTCATCTAWIERDTKHTQCFRCAIGVAPIKKVFKPENRIYSYDELVAIAKEYQDTTKMVTSFRIEPLDNNQYKTIKRYSDGTTTETIK